MFGTEHRLRRLPAYPQGPRSERVHLGRRRFRLSRLMCWGAEVDLSGSRLLVDRVHRLRSTSVPVAPSFTRAENRTPPRSGAFVYDRLWLLGAFAFRSARTSAAGRSCAARCASG